MTRRPGSPWSGSTHPTGFDPDYWRNNENLVEEFRGRKVYVFPVAERGEAITRGEDANEYTVAIITLERCPDQGEVSNAWVDERIAWVEAEVYDFLSNQRIEGEHPVPDTDPTGGEWNQVYSPDLLRQLKLFRSEVTVVYRRVEDA